MRFLKLGLGLAFGCVAVAANASLTFFNNQGTFQTALTGGGNSMVGFEDFEEGVIPAGTAQHMNDPLDSTTSNAFFSPGQIDSHLRVQSNGGGSNSSVLSPNGGLAACNNFGGYPTNFVSSDTFVDATDLIFNGGIVGAGGNFTSLFSSGNFRIDVYDINNVFQGSTNVVVSNTSGFWGVISTSEIGRINLFSTDGQAEGIDNWEMWAAPVPEPATMAALGLGALALLRRRSKK